MIPKIVASLLLVLLGVTVGVYATTLFTQSFTAVPATTPVITANCSQLFSSPGTIAPGSTGGLFFGCTTTACASAPPQTGCALTEAAVTVAADGAATPTFSLPSPYTGVALNNVGSTPPTGGCTFPTGPTVLTSGTAFSFTGTYGKGNSFYYCVSYTAPAGTTSLPSFSVAWTQ